MGNRALGKLEQVEELLLGQWGVLSEGPEI